MYIMPLYCLEAVLKAPEIFLKLKETKHVEDDGRVDTNGFIYLNIYFSNPIVNTIAKVTLLLSFTRALYSGEIKI